MGGHTRIAQGTYPRSVLRHLFLLGPVTLGPGQYSLLWHAWKLAGYYLMSVLSPPLGLGGTIRTLSSTLPIFRHAIKVNIATVPVWQDHVGRGASILTMDMCPRQYGYGLPFRSQANANEKPILTKGNIAILPEGNIALAWGGDLVYNDSWKTIYHAVEKTQCGSFAISEFKVYSIVTESTAARMKMPLLKSILPCQRKENERPFSKGGFKVFLEQIWHQHPAAVRE